MSHGQSFTICQLFVLYSCSCSAVVSPHWRGELLLLSMEDPPQLVLKLVADSKLHKALRSFAGRKEEVGDGPALQLLGSSFFMLKITKY